VGIIPGGKVCGRLFGHEAALVAKRGRAREMFF
jgi:hypothetical protein